MKQHRGPAPSTVRISSETTVGSEKPQRKSACAYSFQREAKGPCEALTERPKVER